MAFLKEHKDYAPGCSVQRYMGKAFCALGSGLRHDARGMTAATHNDGGSGNQDEEEGKRPAHIDPPSRRGTSVSA